MEYGTITISNTNDITSTITHTDDWNITIIVNDSLSFAPGNWYWETGTAGIDGVYNIYEVTCRSTTPYRTSYQEEILKYKTFLQKRSQKIQRWMAILHRRL
jgi:hypothetical protein